MIDSSFAEFDARDVDTVFVYSSDAQLVLSSGPFLLYKVSGSLTPLAPCLLVAVSHREIPRVPVGIKLSNVTAHSSFRLPFPLGNERNCDTPYSRYSSYLLSSVRTMIFEIAQHRSNNKSGSLPVRRSMRVSESEDLTSA